MGILFSSTRKPRQFTHRPVYWDPKKEALEKRKRMVRQQLQAEGKLPKDEVVEAEYNSDYVEREFSTNFLSGASHLRRQRKRGVTKESRSGSIFRSLLILALLAFVVWVFYYR